MPDLMTKEAEAVAAKLNSQVPSKAGRVKFTVTVTEGGKHQIVKVWYGAVWIGQYGIQRGSKQKNHNYIAEQLYLTRKQGYNLAMCPLSVDDYIDILISRGEIEDPEKREDSHEQGEPESR